MKAPIPAWRLVADTYEAMQGGWTLVVRHEFYGSTAAEAQAIFAALGIAVGMFALGGLAGFIAGLAHSR